METPTAEELRELQDRCDGGDEEACAELDRLGIEPPVIEPDQAGAEDNVDARVRMIMRGPEVEELRRLHARLEHSQPGGWVELGEALDDREIPEGRDDYRVPLAQAALDLIRVEVPHLCRLWPQVFGPVDLVPAIGPTLSQIAERARGKTVVDVKPGFQPGTVELVLVNGTKLIFQTAAVRIRERPERPSETAMRLSQAGRS